MIENVNQFQLMFYVVSPIATLLAVGTAYLALTKQSKPLVLIYYEPSHIGSVIDLVISNHGNGSARSITFSEPVPISCWGIEKPNKIERDGFINSEIPVLAPGKEIRYDGGQYAGLSSVIGNTKVINVSYEYKSPLKFSKTGKDESVLDIRYMKLMSSRNSAEYDLSDAMKGKNNTVFLKMNNILSNIEKSLAIISSNVVKGVEK